MKETVQVIACEMFQGAATELSGTIPYKILRDRKGKFVVDASLHVYIFGFDSAPPLRISNGISLSLYDKESCKMWMLKKDCPCMGLVIASDRMNGAQWTACFAKGMHNYAICL